MEEVLSHGYVFCLQMKTLGEGRERVGYFDSGV